jgi:signal peptidase I
MDNATLKKVYLELLITLGLAVMVYLLLHSTVQHSVVEGSSMLPGLENGQRLIVNKTAFLFKAPQRGEVVVIHPPPSISSPDKQWVKRVIGLPGDTIRVEKGIVYVNNFPLDEPYIKESPHYSMANFKVPADNYFVMGDNRNASTDSHYGWTVTRQNVVGEVWLRFWPVNQWGIIHPFPLANELQAQGIISTWP